MTFSPLISGTVPHHGKYSSRGGRPVTRLIQHHWAGIGGGIERMQDPNQQASCTYIITTDGRILGHVPEEYRPWTSGSAEADAPSVTIEVQNTGGQVNGNDSDPSSWPISDAAYGAIIRLLVDVAQRHGWSAIDANTYVGHRQFYSTACPGGFLWARMDQTRQLAQEAFAGGGSLSHAGSTITPIEEDNLMATPEQRRDLIRELLDQTIDESRPGKQITLRQMLSEYRDHVVQTQEKISSVPENLLNARVPRGGQMGGETTLGAVISWSDQHVIDGIAATAAVAANDGATVDDIKAAVKQAIAESVVKVDVTVDSVRP